MTFPPDHFKFDLIIQSTPEEPTYCIPDTKDIYINTQNNSKASQELPEEFLDIFIMQQLQIEKQSLESQTQMHRQFKKRKKSRTKTKKSFSVSKSNNNYSSITSLGFNLIHWLFLIFIGFGIVYIFTYFLHPAMAEALLKAGSIAITPLVVLAFCIVVMVIILESCR